MTDYRLRASALHPSSNISGTLHSSTTMLSSGAMMRPDSYSMPYGVNRAPYHISNGGTMGDMSRYPQYPVSRGLDIPAPTSPGLGYGHPGNLIMEQSTRPANVAEDSPPFNETIVLYPIVTGSQTVRPEIQARIQKGFFQVDRKWTCYRRNYFAVTCSFSLRPWTPNSPLFVQLSNSTERIRSFSMSISAIVNGQDETRELVQHTPKRDKQSERRPGKVTLAVNQQSALVNRGHSSTNHISFGIPPHASPILDYNAGYASQQASQPPNMHTFERIQFQKATANNGKRRAQQQYYNLVVELFAEVSSNGVDSRWVLIAKKLSHPMVVRGRSPGHYKDGRRDSGASMGQNGDSGSSGDGGLGNGFAHSIGQTSRPQIPMMYDAGQRNGTRYDYRQMPSTDRLPVTASPLASSSSSSPGFDYPMMGDSMHPLESIKDATAVDSYAQNAFAATSSGSRKMTADPSSLRLQMPTFEEEATTKSQEQGTVFNDSYLSMIPIMHNDPDGQSQYTKRPNSNAYINQQHDRRSPLPGLNSNRPGDYLYGRFEPVQNPHGLCS